MATAAATQVDEINKQERRFLQKISTLQSECEEAESAYREAKSKAKEAKLELEDCIAELRLAIKRGPSDQQEFDFEDSETGQDEYEEFLEQPVEKVIKLTSKQLEKLINLDVITAGDFEKLRAGTKDYPRGLADVKGIGQATIDKWEEEFLESFDRWKKNEANKKSLLPDDEDDEDDDD